MNEFCEDNDSHDWQSMGYGDRVCDKCGKTDYAESEEDFYKRIYGPVQDAEIKKDA